MLTAGLGGVSSYKEYLGSPEWKTRADGARRRAGFRCQLCNSKGRLHVHHRTYDRIGHERYDDLIVLCEVCHSHFHSGRRVT